MTWTVARTAPTTIHSDEETRARVALVCDGLSGDPTVGGAIRRLGGAAELLHHVQSGTDVDPLGSFGPLAAQAHGSRVDSVITMTERLGLTLISPQHESWPRGLDALGDAAPLLLWIRGAEIVLTEEAAAIVGTRHPSREARHATLEFATSLADRGWVVASGVAPGVEELALRAATAMRGATIAIAPIGLDRHTPTAATSVTVSAEPPTAERTARSIRRARQILAATATRMIVVDEARCWNARMIAETARLLRRPVGRAAATERDEPVATTDVRIDRQAGVVGGSFRLWQRSERRDRAALDEPKRSVCSFTHILRRHDERVLGPGGSEPIAGCLP